MANPNDPESSPLEARQDDGVLTLTMNRPSVKNALDAAQWRRLAAALGDAAIDTSVRAVVLTGANGVFSSGGQLGGEGPAHPLDRMRIISAAAVALHDFPKPTIAKVPGPAIGGGDLRARERVDGEGQRQQHRRRQDDPARGNEARE